MAKATLTETEKRVVTRAVHLELTEDEARTLLSLAGSVGGHPQKSPRAELESIWRELTRALGPYTLQPQKRFLSGTLTFAAFPDED